MLRKEQNDLLTQTGPGTPMGTLMREYWVPALLASELPRPDSDPVRVMLLGERLVAFRETSGEIGLIQNLCPHRGASLFGTWSIRIAWNEPGAKSFKNVRLGGGQRFKRLAMQRWRWRGLCLCETACSYCGDRARELDCGSR